jgi:hypothetical protein
MVAVRPCAMPTAALAFQQLQAGRRQPAGRSASRSPQQATTTAKVRNPSSEGYASIGRPPCPKEVIELDHHSFGICRQDQQSDAEVLHSCCQAPLSKVLLVRVQKVEWLAISTPSRSQ